MDTRILGQLENSPELCRLALAGEQLPASADGLIDLSGFDEVEAYLIIAAAQSPMSDAEPKPKIEDIKKDMDQ